MTAFGSNVAVLGGGFLGLNLARKLARAGFAVTLIEAEPTLGGVSNSHRLGGYAVDRFYHTILPTDSELLDLIAELGLLDDVAWRATRTGFAQGGRIHSVSTPLEFMSFPVLSLSERVRLGWAIWNAQRMTDWSSLEGLTCEEWLTQTCGRSVYEKLWAPLLKCKLGSAAPEVSATFIWATINRLQAGRRSQRVPSRDKMGYLRGGYQRLIDALARDVEDQVDIRVGSPISSIRRPYPEAQWDVVAGGEKLCVDHVVSTIPPHVLSSVLEDEELDRSRLGSVEGLGVVEEVLLLNQPLSPFYILNLGDDVPFTGIIESSNLAPMGEFGTKSVVYLPRYTAPGDPWMKMGDDEIRFEFRSALRRIFPEFEEDWVVESRIHRAPFVQAIHTRDYRSRIPSENPAPGLWIASSTQVHPWPVHNNQILVRASAVAKRMSESKIAEGAVRGKIAAASRA